MGFWAHHKPGAAPPAPGDGITERGTDELQGRPPGEIILSRHSGDIVNPESRALPPETTHKNTGRWSPLTYYLLMHVGFCASEDYKTLWLFLTVLLRGM